MYNRHKTLYLVIGAIVLLSIPLTLNLLTSKSNLSSKAYVPPDMNLPCTFAYPVPKKIPCKVTISPTPIPISSDRFTWMIYKDPLDRLKNFSQDGMNLGKKSFTSHNTYLLSTNDAVSTATTAIPTVGFQSYAEIKNAFDKNTINHLAKAVLYDNENWSFTPLTEQQDPAKYERLSANLVHQHNLIFITAPATDLVKVLDPAGGVPGNIYNDYIRLGIARDAARYADVYEIQAQGDEADTQKFARFVQQASQQAKDANPSVAVLAGISTNPSGKTVTGADLSNAVNATKNYVSGYWLNIPGQSPGCPNCGISKVQVAIDFLRKLTH